jgi:hypothetical protein
MDSTYQEIGISVLADSSSATSVGPLLVTQDFGRRGNYGDARVLGVVFADGDGDSFYDAGEGQGGITITVSNGSVSYTTTTMSAGGYQLAVAPGTYSVMASGGGLSGSVFMDSITVGSQNVKVDLDSSALATTGSVGGTLFHDLDESGQQNGAESGLAGWTVYVDTNANGVLDSGERSAITTATGSYLIAAVSPGSWQVRAVDQTGYRSTTPDVQLATVNAGAAQTGVQFGKFQFLRVSGNTATLLGTSGNDTLTWTAGVSHGAVLNGKAFTFDSAVVTNFMIEGRGGTDSIDLTGGPAADTATVRLQDTTLTSAAYSVRALGVETVVIHAGNGGTQTAHLYDSSNNDTVVAHQNYRSV